MLFDILIITIWLLLLAFVCYKIGPWFFDKELYIKIIYNLKCLPVTLITVFIIVVLVLLALIQPLIALTILFILLFFLLKFLKMI